MLEQSILHGKVYLITQTDTTLTSKPVAINEVYFGPMRPIDMYVISDTEIFICDKNRDE